MKIGVRLDSFNRGERGQTQRKRVMFIRVALLYKLVLATSTNTLPLRLSASSAVSLLTQR